MVSVAFHSALRYLVQRVAFQVDKLTGGKLHLGNPMAENKRSKMMRAGYFTAFGLSNVLPAIFCPNRVKFWPRLLLGPFVCTVIHNKKYLYELSYVPGLIV